MLSHRRQLLALSLALLVPRAAFPQQEWLKVAVIEGENASHNIRRKAVSPTVVEVRDERGQPAVGAQVEFLLPALGPGGLFSDGTRTSTGVAGEDGRVALTGFVPNDAEGRFTIVVKARLGTREGSTSITQNNTLFQSSASAAPPRSSSTGRSKLFLVLVAGAGAAAAGIVAVRGGRQSGSAGTTTTTSSPTTVTIGGITVGGPR